MPGPPEPTLRITEIFHSIQGESTWAGRPCVFVRLTGCHLRCRYCDTEYAFREGRRRSVADVLREVLGYPAPLVEITGGEPLLQEAVHGLMSALCDAGRTVLLETSGACDISACDPRVIRILDVKTPGSGEAARFLASNLHHLRPHDEVKFVLTDRSDYEFARDFVVRHRLPGRVREILFSPVFEQPAGMEIEGCEAMQPRDLAGWMLEDGVHARLQLQLHKHIWAPATRGV
ncbi:MAG: radical SAM protein [Phycisphaeraceae bacterium]|nr:radical SAM protein [Phycisphaeraceae bacterium]